MEEELRNISESYFQAYREPSENVTLFTYLGRVMTVGDEYWPAVARNLRKARKIWVRMTRIMIREGTYPKVSGLFFNAVVQAVLIFGAELWVLTPRMEWELIIFQHRVALRLTRKQPRWRGERIWEYPPLASAIEEAGFEEIRVYTTRRQITVTKYIKTQPILDLCE